MIDSFLAFKQYCESNGLSMSITFQSSSKKGSKNVPDPVPGVSLPVDTDKAVLGIVEQVNKSTNKKEGLF